jgi:uncharacterized protein YndB with AHSA1/START domain
MIQVKIDIIINRPIQEVFEKLIDIPGYNEWMPDKGLFVSCTKDSEGPVGPGTLYSDKTLIGTVRGRVSEFDRPNKVVFQYRAERGGKIIMEGWPGYKLENKNNGTTILHHFAKGYLYGPFRLLQPVIQRIARNERQRTVNALKQVLESTEK